MTALARGLDRIRTAAIATAPDGTCRYANPAALEHADACGHLLEDARPVPEELLAHTSALATEDGSTRVHLLRPGGDRQRADRFAVESADALAGILNLRRTVHRVVDLARSGFGGAVGVDLPGDRTIRRIAADTTGKVVDDTVRRRTLDADTARRIDTVARQPARQTLLTDESGIAVLTTIPLSTTTGDRGVLWIRTTVDECPALDEVVAFARRATTAISSARVYEERAELASTLRAALLPPPLPDVPGVQLGAAYRPAQTTTQIGGDFYEVSDRDGAWTVTIGDVCGKGVDAAVLTGRVRQSIRTATLVTDDPQRVLELVNDTLRVDDGTTFVTLLHGLLTVGADRVRVRLAAGGHPEPLLLHAGHVDAVPVHGTIVGMLSDVEFEPVDVDLAPGDLLLMYTDGAPEARGANGLLGVEPIAAMLADSDGMTAQAVTERLMQLVLEHLDGRPHDDVAFLAIRAAVRAAARAAS